MWLAQAPPAQTESGKPIPVPPPPWLPAPDAEAPTELQTTGRGLTGGPAVGALLLPQSSDSETGGSQAIDPQDPKKRKGDCSLTDR